MRYLACIYVIDIQWCASSRDIWKYMRKLVEGFLMNFTQLDIIYVCLPICLQVMLLRKSSLVADPYRSSPLSQNILTKSTRNPLIYFV